MSYQKLMEEIKDYNARDRLKRVAKIIREEYPQAAQDERIKELLTEVA